jgi:AGZA family xanthine/uracil permease-like MFS transporter
MLALIPTVAILPILLYIGMLIGSQAFQETPRAHAPAIVLSLTPHLANWGVTLINGALAATGTVVGALSVTQLQELVARMKNEGVLYHGLQVLGGGSILGGLVLGAITVCIIDRTFKKAAGFALAGAVLTFFGFMHGERIGVNETPAVALSYLLVSGILFVCSRYAKVAASASQENPENPHEVERSLHPVDAVASVPAVANV